MYPTAGARVYNNNVPNLWDPRNTASCILNRFFSSLARNGRFWLPPLVLRSSVGRQIIRDVTKPKFDLVSVFIPTETRRLQILSPLFLSLFFS